MNPKKIKGGCKLNSTEGAKKIITPQCPAVKATRQARLALIHSQRAPQPDVERIEKLRAELHTLKRTGLETFCATCRHASTEEKEE